jgi:hypothetical protein
MRIYGFKEYLMLADEVDNVGLGELISMDKNGTDYVFNMLFSKRGKV